MLNKELKRTSKEKKEGVKIGDLKLKDVTKSMFDDGAPLF